MNKNLKTFQLIFNLTDSELSEILQVEPSALNDFLIGKVLLSDQSIKRVTKLYRINPNWLVYAKGEMYQDDYPKILKNSPELEEMIPILREIPKDKWKILKVLIHLLL